MLIYFPLGTAAVQFPEHFGAFVCQEHPVTVKIYEALTVGGEPLVQRQRVCLLNNNIQRQHVTYSGIDKRK